MNPPAAFDGTDFQLPGIALHGDKQLIIAISHAHSLRFNRRRLEGHLYGPWDIVLNYLVTDMRPNTFVVAQYCLDGKIASLADSVITLAGKGKGNKQHTPDFTIIMTIPVQRNDDLLLSLEINADLTDWEEVYVLFSRTPTLVELKRPPTRRPKSFEVFISGVQKFLQRAQDQLMLQASKVFESQPDCKEVVLIASSGVWWQWKICTHMGIKEKAIRQPPTHLDQPEESPETSEDESSEDEDDEDPDDEYTVAKGKGPPVPTSSRTIRPRDQLNEKIYKEPKQKKITMNDLTVWNPPEPESSDDDEGFSMTADGKRKYPVKYFRDLGEPFMETLVNDVEKVKEERTNVWSNIIFLGSPISNQAFYIIHEFLKEVEHVLLEKAEVWVQKENGTQEAQDAEDGQNGQSSQEGAGQAGGSSSVQS
ncbi:hypothetical protein Hypma_012305 [Hypsizygus marmoreus]|uniref:Uncharacterized protein n=1 Tax=Hypsizygus marmoreus TaxID=39966 RepID=A0A369JHA3_HYPMA|nr:hypothetical protein Hypma_012305 [Hypsizygus marmoreus]